MNKAYELRVCDWWPYIIRLRATGHTPVRFEKTCEGYKLLVDFKCGITDYLTVQEREILENDTMG